MKDFCTKQMEHPRHKVSGPPSKLIKQNDVDGIAIGDWQIIATKKNIANSEELEAYVDVLCD